MSDKDYITEADVAGADDRPTVFGVPYTDDDLMSHDEWWDEFRANACCARSNRWCPCGGTARLPSETSRLLYDPLHEEEYLP